MSEINFISGALIDNVPQEEKDKRYVQSEIVASIAPVVWKKKTKYTTYPVRKQGTSGKCVMASCEKERGIIAKQKYGEFIVFSDNKGYQLRDNTDISGSSYADLIRATNHGAVLDVLSPSQSISDEEAMAVKDPSYYDDLAKVFGAKRITMGMSIDTIASTIENTGKGVGITLRFGPGEWFGNYKVKELLPREKQEWGHRVVAVDFTLGDDGIKYLVIEDSACEDGYPQRLVSESFLDARQYWDPNYIVNFKTYQEMGIVPIRPRFDGSIVSFQKCLKYEGIFPANVDEIESYGPLTRNCCIIFQNRYNITPALGNLGSITKSKLLELYP